MYTFYRGTEEYHTDNLAGFCREHGLRRSHMNEVVQGKRQQHHGFSTDEKPKGSTSSTDVLAMATIAARSVGGDYEKMVMERVAQVRRGDPIVVHVDEELGSEIEELRSLGAVSPQWADVSPLGGQ